MPADGDGACATTEMPSLDEHLCFALYAASMAMSRAYKPMLDRIGLTYPQYLVLNVLLEDAPRTVGAIASTLGLDASTVTPLVKRMEAAGLLCRSRSPDDERQVRVSLTSAGLALQSAAACAAEAVFCKTGMTREEVAALNRDVRTLRARLTLN